MSKILVNKSRERCLPTKANMPLKQGAVLWHLDLQSFFWNAYILGVPIEKKISTLLPPRGPILSRSKCDRSEMDITHMVWQWLQVFGDLPIKWNFLSPWLPFECPANNCNRNSKAASVPIGCLTRLQQFKSKKSNHGINMNMNRSSSAQKFHVILTRK